MLGSLMVMVGAGLLIGSFWVQRSKAIETKPVDKAMTDTRKVEIKLTQAEIQSGFDRVRWAEGLILQLPVDHDGRNSWLLNYGKSHEAVAKRLKRDIRFDSRVQAAHSLDMEPQS